MRRLPPQTAQRQHSAKGIIGFTLLEILVAAAVLALILVLLSQIISVSGITIGQTRRQLDAASQARLFLDRLGSDLAARVARADAAVELTNADGNDSLRFYAEARGYQGNRQVSLIGYRVWENEAERGASGHDWNTPPQLGASLPVLNNASYEVLSNGIFRLEICYRKKDGMLTGIPPADFSDIAALVVTVAALDASSRGRLDDSQLDQLGGALPDPAEGQSPLPAWKQALAQPNFAGSLPRQAVQAVEVYQRSYLLP